MANLHACTNNSHLETFTVDNIWLLRVVNMSMCLLKYYVSYPYSIVSTV